MALEDARKFLARVVPWTEDGSAFINLHFPMQKEGYDRPIWLGTGHRTLNDLIRTLEYRVTNEATQGVFICMSSQRLAEESTSPRGFKWYKAKRSSVDAVGHKSLYLDIDVKEGAYSTTTEAVRALNKFCKDTGLPPPTAIVRTGSGGLHVHWVVTEALSSAQWKPLAFALAEATKRHGLICDSQCTVDAARILRIPGSLDRRKSPPVEIKLLALQEGDYLLETLETILAPFAPAPLMTIEGELAHAFAGGDNELGAGIESSAPLVHLDDVAKECGFINEAVTTGGKNFSNPLWNLTTLIATFTDDTNADAHRMASGHPSYDVAGTDQLLIRKQADKSSKGLGWPKCQTISASGSTHCAGCPHFNGGKSPLNFGLLQAQLPPVKSLNAFDMLPAGYVRDRRGHIFMQKPKDDGSVEEVPIFPFDLTNVRLLGETSGWRMQFEVARADAIDVIELPLGQMATTDKLRTALKDGGLPLSARECRDFQDMTDVWIKKLRDAAGMIESARAFGWWLNRDNQLGGFTYAGSTFTPAGENSTSMESPDLARMYRPRGVIDPWIAMAKVITDQKRPALDAIIASAFAGPLVRFTGQNGLLMSAYSPESGIGKSTAMRIAQSVWGDPIKAMQGLDDTANSVFKKLGALHNLPLFWDEMKTQKQTDDFIKIAFQLSGGKEKSRLTSNVEQRDVGTWQTVFVSASNDSILDAANEQNKTSAAGLYRMFEFKVPPGGPVTNQFNVARQSHLLNENFGCAGHVYAKFLGENFSAIEQDMIDLGREIEAQVSMHQDERFWTALITCIVQGAKYANELELTDIDVDALRVFMLQCLEGMRTERRVRSADLTVADNMGDLLARYLASRRVDGTVLTERIQRGGGLSAEAKRIINDVTKLRETKVHLGQKCGMIRINKADFAGWLKHAGYTKQAVFDTLRGQYGVIELVARLAGGTTHTTAYMRCLEIDTNTAAWGSSLKVTEEEAH